MQNHSTPIISDIPNVMRALVLNGMGFENLSIAKIPVPEPGPRQMLARVDAAGICTSLIKLVEQGPAHRFLYGWDIERYPLILGDEGAVTLAVIGEELRDQYHPGERCVIQPAVDHAPINHRERYADNASGVEKIAVGYTLPGNLAEYILIPEEVLDAGCLRPLPDPALPYAHTSTSEPISCVISGQDHHVHLVQENPLSTRRVIKGLKPGGVTVIVGVGVMGRMHVDLALSYRPRAIAAVDISDDRLVQVKNHYGDRAEKLNISLHVVNPMQSDVMELINQLTDHRGADDVIIAVGSAKAIESAQEYVGRGGVLNLFGGLKAGEDVIGLNAGIIHYKEINVTGSSGGSPQDIDRTLELMARSDIDPGTYITKIGDLGHSIQFLEMIKSREIDGKAIVYPHRRTKEILSVPLWSAEDERDYLAGNTA